MVRIAGKITDEPILSHEWDGDLFYKIIVAVKRQSGTYDYIPVIMPERFISDNGSHRFYPGTGVAIIGSLRSYNEDRAGKRCLVVYVKPERIIFGDFEAENDVEFNCILGKRPIKRTTPKGRNICDMLVVINDNSRKCSYIPLIAFGNLSKQCESMSIGTQINVSGRIQSRIYIKDGAERTTIEIVANKIAPSV